MEGTAFVQGPSFPKRKRGRPPKARYPIPNEVEFPASHLSEETIKELQMAYKPLKEIMGIYKLRPLVEKPDELLYGLHDYYDLIEEPIWFLEISRKFAEKEYISITEVMKDVRLVLENCYRFWGKKHKFVKQALRAEKILAKHVVEFPPDVRAKACLALYDSEEALSNEKEADHSFLAEEYTSNILQNLEKNPIKSKMGASLEVMEKWEKEVLESEEFERQIQLIPELAEIGQFLLMAREILCLKPISQYEIERMLLIARESLTLATIMTSFLCPTAMRPALYFKPIMVYDVWASFLQKKLDSWYKAYSNYHSRMQVFLKYGVEPSFFELFGEVNPLSLTPFHELNLPKKACILKALCSNMFHSNKKIEEYFNLVDESSLKAKVLGSDSKYEYVSLFSPEIRVYRCSKISLDIEETIEAVHPGYFTYQPSAEGSKDGSDMKESWSKKQKFCLFAKDREGLSSLSKMFAKKRSSRGATNRLLAEDKNYEISLIGLRALYNEWQKAIYKDAASVEISKNYWIMKVVNNGTTPEASESPAPSGEGIVEESAEASSNLGKRIMKRKYPVDNGEGFSSNDEKANEEDISDWEDGNIRRSQRIKRVPGLPRFFNRKYMKFDSMSEDFTAEGTSRKKGANKENKLPGLKKPRKKREPKNPDDPSQRKVLRRKTVKELSRKFPLNNYELTRRTLLGADLQEDAYLPPIEVPQLTSTNPQGNLNKELPFLNPLGSGSAQSGDNDLFDWGGWDLGLTFPPAAPLKPVDEISNVPDEGEKKLLELGTFKKKLAPMSAMLSERPICLPGLSNRRPNVTERRLAVPLPRTVNRPFQKLPPPPPPAQPNFMFIGNRIGDRFISTPGPSRAPNRTFMHPKMPLMVDTRFIPADTMVVKTGPTQVKIPVQRPVLQPFPPNPFVKRKVNLPARPLSIPVLNNQEFPVFEQAWTNAAGSRTVLYIPSGTPTITIPSASGSKEERTLTVL